MNLIEIILASAMMIIALVGITQVSSKSLFMSSVAATQAQADAYLNNLIENDQKERKKGWDSFCAYLLQPTPTVKPGFTTISRTDDAADCAAGQVKITYTIYWSAEDFKSRSAVYTRY